MKIGNRVFHRSMQEYGTIERVGRDGSVYVCYDRKSERDGRPWRGIYNRDWFQIHPDLLVVTDRVADRSPEQSGDKSPSPETGPKAAIGPVAAPHKGAATLND